jgi:hypothetical protein
MKKHITHGVLVLALIFPPSFSNAQQGAALSEDAMAHCVTIASIIYQALDGQTDKQLQDLRSTAASVYDGYLSYTRNYVTKNKIPESAFLQSAKVFETLPAENQIQILLNCRDNPKRPY